MMVGLPLLVLVVIVAVIAVARTRTRAATGADVMAAPSPLIGTSTANEPASSAPRHRHGHDTATVEDRLDQWVAAGLLAPDQAAAIRAFEHPATPAEPAHDGERRRRVPPLAEALGYLGGLLGVIGLTVFVAGFWRDMEPSTRLIVSLAVTAVLVGVGFVVRPGDDVSLMRLRSFIWLVGSAAAGVLGGVVAYDVIDATHPRSVATGVAVGVLLVSAALWAWRDRPAQAFTMFAAMLVAVGTGVWNLSDGVPAGVTVIVAATVLMVVGLARAVPSAWVATIVGAAGLEAGAIMTTSEWNEKGNALIAACMIVVLAVAESPMLRTNLTERVLLLVIGVPSLVSSALPAIFYFGRNAGIATGTVVLAIGAAVVAAGAADVVRHRIAAQLVGGLVVVGGAATMGMQSDAVATIVGLATALVMLALGTRQGLAFLSITGSAGLLVHVPWAISHFFPGKNRAPLLIAVSGLLLVAIAVALTRMGGRFRHELKS